MIRDMAVEPGIRSPSVRPWIAAAMLMVAAACADEVTPPVGEGVRAPVTVSATLTPAQQALVAAMSVEVTGQGITTPILATLTVNGATVNGTVRVPVGASRTFTVHAFDAQATETYNGSATATVAPGTNPPLVVRMTAVEGSVPIDVTIGSYGITISPPTATVAVNSEVTLTATSTGAMPAGVPTWGAINPALVTITPSADGRSAIVRGRLAGTTRVVVSHAGVGAASEVTVTGVAANQPPSAVVNGPYSGAAGTMIVLSSAGSRDADGSIVSFAWDFGDGTTSDLASPAKSWSAAGTYTVRLTVTDDDGATSSATTTATIGAAVAPFRLRNLVVGRAHACGQAPDGAWYCWGDNTYGQLGNGTFTSSNRPVRLGILYPLLFAGGDNTCGINPSISRFECWGRNDAGQLGNGATDTPGVWSPTPVFGLSGTGKIVPGFVALGGSHSCAVVSTGAMKCWGDNSHGQLGDGTRTRRLTPTSVTSTTTWKENAIVAGDGHTCALTSTGSLYCWGANDRAQSGIANTPDGFTVPTQVPLPGNASPTFSSVSGHFATTCAQESSSGPFWCWGDNSYGQMGHSQYAFGGPSQSLAGSMGLTFGCGHVNAVLSCWGGDNSYGQLGDGTTASHLAPAPVAGGASFRDRLYSQAGAAHSCAIYLDGSLQSYYPIYCWGDNSKGQLGDGTNVSRSVPTLVLAPSATSAVIVP